MRVAAEEMLMMRPPLGMWGRVRWTRKRSDLVLMVKRWSKSSGVTSWMRADPLAAALLTRMSSWFFSRVE